MRRLAPLLLAWLALQPAMAADGMAVIELEHRSAEELVPVLRPLAGEDAVVTGTGNRIVIRAGQAQREMLRSVIAELDRPLRRFRIAVSQGFQGSRDRQAADARVRLATGREGARAKARVRTLATHGREDRHVDAFVQALEGRPALVRTGRSVPLADRELLLTPEGAVAVDTVRYRDLDSGFYVVVRPGKGDEVTLDIYPVDARLDPDRPARIETHAVATSVRARLGEWVPLAGTRTRRDARDDAIVAHTRARGERDTAVWLRVEALP